MRGRRGEIVDAKVIVGVRAGTFVSLKLTVEDGISGCGDAPFNGRELAVASYLNDHGIRLLVGPTPAALKTLGTTCTARRIGAATPVTMSAISAVDAALWNIRARPSMCPCISF
jgi:mannonate dehydratase